MLHQPAAASNEGAASAHKTGLGIVMFIIYALVYAGFVAINVIHPAAMGTKIIFGLNLAVVYGFGLIVFALVLALIYHFLCLKIEARTAASQEATQGPTDTPD